MTQQHQGVLDFYLKVVSLPMIIVKTVVLLGIFKSPLFEYACASGDYFAEIYYILLYTIFLIPLFDFPAIGLLSLVKDKRPLVKRVLISLGRAFGGSYLVIVVTVLLALLQLLIIYLFRLPLCSVGD